MLVENAGLFVLLLLFAFLFIRDSGRRDIYPFRKTNNSIPWGEVFETLKRGCVKTLAQPHLYFKFCYIFFWLCIIRKSKCSRVSK